MSEVVYQRFSLDEMQWVFPVFLESLDALLVSMGEEPFCDVQDKEQVEVQWQRRRSFMQHLTQTADNNWVAVRDGQPIGYARSLVRDNVRQLSEMFLIPSAQSNGVGRELLDRAFPKDESRNRIVIASPDKRAVPAYLKRGVYPRFSLYYMERKPEIVPYETDLQIVPLRDSDEHLAHLNQLDRIIIGYVRTIDHQFFINSSGDRTGYLFLRDGQVAGYGYVGKRTGPIALLDVNDFPAVLAFAETDTAENGRETFGVTVPLINTVAVDFMLSRKARIDMAFLEQFMMAVPMGKFENYICTLPELIS